MMSLNVFITLCIVGIDFLVYFLFQWTYGDKRRAMARKLAELRKTAEPQAPRPYLVSTQKPVEGLRTQAQSRLESGIHRLATPRDQSGSYRQRLA
jgi:hypothetical protein